MLSKKEIGCLIKEQRREKEITQNDLSKLTGLSRTYIADVEGGRYNPSLVTLLKISNVLNFDLGILNSSKKEEISWTSITKSTDGR